MYIYVCVCETEKARRRSGGLWRNEGVQGQSEATGLFRQSADEELIRREIFLAQKEKQKKKEICLRNKEKNPLLLNFSLNS